jgi:hypothetical protein
VRLTHALKTYPRSRRGLPSVLPATLLGRSPPRDAAGEKSERLSCLVRDSVLSCILGVELVHDVLEMLANAST